jgi:hypothetical protein
MVLLDSYPKWSSPLFISQKAETPTQTRHLAILGIHLASNSKYLWTWFCSVFLFHFCPLQVIDPKMISNWNFDVLYGFAQLHKHIFKFHSSGNPNTHFELLFFPFRIHIFLSIGNHLRANIWKRGRETEREREILSEVDWNLHKKAKF